MTINPGATTVIDVRSRLFPRTTIQTPGVAPMSSMFFLGPAGRRRFDDFRGAVHDSDGPKMWTGAGEHLWRPLSNPPTVQISAFQDHDPKGFGRLQRRKSEEHTSKLKSLMRVSNANFCLT